MIQFNNMFNLDNIYNVNCYEAIKEIPDKSIDLIITDPPYLIEGIHGSGIMRDRNGKQWNYATQIQNNKLDKGIDFSILDEFIRVQKYINIYIYSSRKQLLDYMNYYVNEKKCNFEIIVWGKENPIAFCGTHYLCDKEYCLYFWEQGAKVHIPFERAKTIYLSNTNIYDKKLYKHPTIKPLDQTVNFVLNSSDENDIVLDCFAGSGTTLVACKQLNRHYIGFEINKEYYEIAKDRLNGISQRDRDIEKKGQIRFDL